VQQAPALSSKCGQRHDESRRRRLNKVLFKSVVRYYFTSLCSNFCINFLDNFVFGVLKIIRERMSPVSKPADAQEGGTGGRLSGGGRSF